MILNIDVFNTSIVVSPYNEENSIPRLEEMYTAEDKFAMKPVACGYLINDGKLFLPRGTPVSLVESLVGTKANTNHPSDPSEKMSREHKSYYEPRDELQERSIQFLMKEKNPQLALNLLMSVGKTFISCYCSTMLNEKTLIITHNEGIKGQWIKTYSKMFDYKPKELLNIAGSSIIEAIMNDDVAPADVYFVNHQTLRSYLSNTNGYMLHKFFKKLKIGIKIYDESHLEFANILLLDFFSNTKRTWYLTATFDRSDKTESVCFKRAFNSVEAFGEIESKEALDKHVVYHVVNINSRASPRDKGRMVGFRGMTAASYGHYAFKFDTKCTAYNAVLILLDKIKDVEGKTLIFVPLIEVVDDLVNKLKKVSDKSVAGYHSQISKDEKGDALKKDIIVSTIKSMGVGRDLPGLRNIICVEPIASKVVASQLIGRLRPYAGGKLTYFFDIVDVSIPPINWWFKARMKSIQNLAKEIVYLNIDE